MKRLPSPHHPRGVSLIEAMMAMVVFVLGILGVMQMNILASQQNNVARGEATASKIARDLVQAFDRLPFNHPLFEHQTSVLHTTAEFTNFENTTGRFLLRDAETLTVAGSARPLVSAAMATVTVETAATNRSGFGNYEVAWRAAPIYAAENPLLVEGRVIVVMVRFRTVGGTFRQVNMWTVKYDPAAVIGAGATIQEI
jgi:type IV pilus assembly protein PilV